MLISRLLRRIFLLVMCLLLAQPILASNGTVTDCSAFNDNNAGDGPDTLGELLPGGGTITFACGGGIQVPEIIISTDSVLDATGQNVTLSGDYTHRIFVVNPNTRLELIHLSVNGGRYQGQPPEGDGAAVYNNGGTVVITDSTFFDNHAFQGGAVCNDGGTMTVTNSTFTNNEAIFGGALANLGGTVTITGSSTFTNNESQGAGAAVLNGDNANGDPTFMTITNSTFSNNHAMGSGGAIQNHTTAATLTISNTTLTGNRAGFSGDPGVGGAVDNDGTLTINNSSISNNRALDGGGLNINAGMVEISSTTFSGNSARFGGGVYNTGGTVTVTGSSFTNNESAGAGGGVVNDGSDMIASMMITNSLFSGNHAMGCCGAIQNHGDNDLMTITNSTISGNHADFDAGGVSNNGVLTISYTTLSGNVAPTGHAGGFQNFTGTTTITNSLIANNTGGDCLRLAGTILLQERNLIEDGSCGAPLRGDPLLGPLQNNGGTTFTHALLSGSLALSAATGICPVTDQRGVSRPQGSGCDLGAFEGVDTSPLDAAPKLMVFSTRTPTLNWNTITWATGYKIQLSGSSSFSESSYQQNGDLEADTLSYTVPSDSPLSEGVPYYWRVCAKDDDDLCGSWSDIESFTIDVP